MLKMLMELAADRCPQDFAASGFMTAYRVLARAQADQPAAVRRLLAYPGTGAWLGHCLRRIAAAPADASPTVRADLGYLGWLAATALAESDTDASLPVMVRSGNVMLPARGLARVTATAESGIGDFRWTGPGRFEITFGGTRHSIATREDDADPAWLPLHGVGLADSDPASILLDDADPFLTGEGSRADREPLTPRQRFSRLTPWQSFFDAAAELLDACCPERSEPIVAWLRTIQPIAHRRSPNAASETSPESFGGLAMNAPHDPGVLVRTLIHEFQHAVLGALLDDVVLTAPTLERRFYAPWTGTLRPVRMLLQGAYAHVGTAAFWDGYRRSAAGRSERQFAEAEHARIQADVRQAVGELLASGLLTLEGERFVSRLHGTTGSHRRSRSDGGQVG